MEQIWPPALTENGTVEDQNNNRCPGYCGIEWCNGYGMLILLFVLTYVTLFYFHILKRFWGKKINGSILKPISHTTSRIFSHR